MKELLDSMQALARRLLAIRTPSVEFATDEEQALVEELGRRCPGNRLADAIYAVTEETTEPWRVGSLFDHLIWATPDNGLSLIQSVEPWLDGDEPRKVLYRLAMQYILGPAPEDIETYKRRWPAWAGRFDEMLAERQHQRDWLN